MKILVTGGAGYIGSHMVKLLASHGHDLVVFDDLSTGFRDAVVAGEFIHGSLSNLADLDELFTLHKFDMVFHLAGFIAIGESVCNPAKYYRNIVDATINLLDAMRMHGVDKLVFSSSAAVFGIPTRIPVDETHATSPINPYGSAKLIVENMLKDYEKAYGLHSVVLRYFNAAGADPDGELRDRHNPETHLIPLALRATLNCGEILTIFGADYDTPDGTCIRDYVHVTDLCDAHLLALQYLSAGGTSCAYNLGNGQGYSVKEVIAVVERVTGKNVALQYGSRRAGDPCRLVADSTKIMNDWGWTPHFGELEKIVLHAWQSVLSSNKTTK